MRSLFPPLQWLANYQRQWLRSDLVAGITLAAYAIPVSMAYAAARRIAAAAGHLWLPARRTLLRCVRHVAATGDRAHVGSGAARQRLRHGHGGGRHARYGQIAALAAFVVAGMAIFAWLLRLSRLVSFISDTILLGFKAGAALTIAMTQLPKLFGVPGGGDGFFERGWTLAGQLGNTNLVVLGLGLAALALLLLGERFLPNRPISLFVVALATAVVSLTSLADLDVATVGVLPSGLPTQSSLAAAARRGRHSPPSAACFLLAYIEGVSAARPWRPGMTT